MDNSTAVNTITRQPPGVSTGFFSSFKFWSEHVSTLISYTGACAHTY